MFPLCNTHISLFLPAEQVASTYVRNEVTLPPPAAVSIQGCPYTHSALGAIRTEPALSRQERVPLKNGYGLGRTSNPFPRQTPVSTEGTHSYNLSFLILCAGHV